MARLQSSGLNPELDLKALKNVNKKIMPGVEEIEDLEKFNPDVAGTANPMPSPAPIPNVPQPAMGSQVSPQSNDPRASQVMTAPPQPVEPPQPVMANPNPPTHKPIGDTERRIGENLPAAAGMRQLQEQPQSQPEIQSQPAVEYGSTKPIEKDYGYGPREDGTNKGNGYFGPIQMTDGSNRVMTEIGMGVNFDGKETLIPSIVPTLTHAEMDHLRKGGKPTPEIFQKALDHAELRMNQGKSPFAEEGEQVAIGSQQGETPWGRLGRWLKEKQQEPTIGSETVKKGYKSALPKISFEPTEFEKEAERRTKEYGRRFPSWGPQEPLETKPTPQQEQHPEVKAYFSPVDEVADSTEHQAEFERQTKLPFTPEIKQDAEVGHEAKEHLESGIEDTTGLSDQAKRLVENIKSNQATEADKYMIGLAVLMPLIVGGMFGKEAGFGALAGGMKGISDVYGRRKKDTQESEKLLAEIDKTKAAQQAAVAKGDLASAYPDVTWIDENGQEHQDKELSPGISVDKKYLKSKEQINSITDRHKELIKDLENASNLIEPLKISKSIIEQLKEQGNDGFFNQYKQWALHGYDPQLSAKFAPTVIIDGEEVNAATALRSAIGQSNGPYAKMYHMGQPDKAQQELQAKRLGDPTSGFTSAEQADYMVGSFLDEVLNAVDKKVSFNGMRLDPERFSFEKQGKGIKKKKEAKKEGKELGSLVSGFVERGE
jgi:hypothetical protein